MLIPDPALVWLLGPSGSGKSTWAAAHYRPEEIVSSDDLRGRVGSGEGDLRASTDAFAVLEMMAAARLRRGMTVVVDTLGFDSELRHRLGEVARAAGVPSVVTAFDAGLETCLARNESRPRPLPRQVIRTQVKGFRSVLTEIEGEGREVVTVSGPPPAPAGEPVPVPNASPGRSGLSFYLHISQFTFGADPVDIGRVLQEVAVAAETAGFAGISLMDHLFQIPQVGRRWDPILEPYTTLGHLSAVAPSLEVGTLVTPVTFRNVGLLAKLVATLDVLSGGRAFCGLGAGWFAAEHHACGLPFPSPGERLDLLSDSIAALRALWGPGSKPFSSQTIDLPDTSSYPRPLRGHVPVLVGGGGERRTLGIVARQADRWNLAGGFAHFAQKRAVLLERCAEVGRDPAEIEMSLLDPVLVGSDRAQVAELIERHRERSDAVDYARRVNTGTIEQHIERYRGMAAAGAGAVFVGLADLDSSAPVERFSAVIGALRD